PDNVAIRHYRLLRRKCRPYLPRLHIYLGDTKDAHTHQSRRCNTISPWAPHPPVAEWLFGCVPRPPPSPIDSAFCGPQVSECRFCFFITDKGVQLVHFRFFHFLDRKS